MLILVSVICVIDFTEKNDDFIRNNLTAKAILLDYYLNLFPYWVSECDQGYLAGAPALAFTFAT